MHGQSLLAEGLTVAQVVHDYGDICQIVTELAIERHIPISTADFRAFNRCLDDAIAGAVTEYGRVREQSIAAAGAERLGVLAHEMRNVLSTAMLSFDTIKRGVAGTGGSVGAMAHPRSSQLVRLRDLIDRSLTRVRLDAEIIRRERVVVAEFLEEEEIAATIRAGMSGLELAVSPTDVAFVVEIDRQVMAGALANLLQNAFKFTRPHSRVTLSTRVTALCACSSTSRTSAAACRRARPRSSFARSSSTERTVRGSVWGSDRPTRRRRERRRAERRRSSGARLPLHDRSPEVPAAPAGVTTNRLPSAEGLAARRVRQLPPDFPRTISAPRELLERGCLRRSPVRDLSRAATSSRSACFGTTPRQRLCQNAHTTSPATASPLRAAWSIHRATS